jgi:hypothetical protein
LKKDKNLREEEDPKEESGRDKLALGDQEKRRGGGMWGLLGVLIKDKKRTRERILSY